MIVPMKKVSIIVLDSDKRGSLENLKKLGVLHIEQIEGTNEDVTRLENKKAAYEKALFSLVIPKNADLSARLPEDVPDNVIDRILELQDRKRKIREDLEKLCREEERLGVWGDFDPALMKELSAKSVFVTPCEGSPDVYGKLQEQFSCVMFSSGKTLVRFALITFGSPPEIPEDFTTIKKIAIPEDSLSRVREIIAEKNGELEQIDEELLNTVRYKQELDDALSHVEEKLNFEKVHASMGREDTLAYLTGFLPKSDADKLTETASQKGWGLLVDDPGEGDAVPSLVKNPKWIRIIEPIFGMLGTVPGYREFDISFFFLVFFSIFVALIIGDAGYGSVLFLGIVFIMIKTVIAKKPISPGLVLFLVLSVCTIGWGTITGTWFSNRAIAETPFLSRLVIPALYSFNPKSGELVKYICFIMGTIHLSIAHIWNFIDQVRKKPFIKSLAQLGWLSLVLGLFYLVLNMVLDATKFPLPRFALFMIIGGLAFIIFFGKQEGKFFKGLLQGVGGLLTTFLSSISCFSDIISYIRLFAVGLATVAIASSFNQMASGGGGIVAIIGSVVILIFGHTLNLAMAALSVIVHGVRLNMLEFSGHLGMEWTGVPYKPFRTAEVKE